MQDDRKLHINILFGLQIVLYEENANVCFLYHVIQRFTETIG